MTGILQTKPPSNGALRHPEVGAMNPIQTHGEMESRRDF